MSLHQYNLQLFLAFFLKQGCSRSFSSVAVFKLSELGEKRQIIASNIHNNLEFFLLLITLLNSYSLKFVDFSSKTCKFKGLESIFMGLFLDTLGFSFSTLSIVTLSDQNTLSKPLQG